MEIVIKTVTEVEKDWVMKIVRGWGADFIVSRGRKVYPTDVGGFYAESQSEKKLGLATYEIIDDQCELVTLDAFEQFSGVGTLLLDSVAQAAHKAGCKRLWLITTNDNLDAIRFYQKRQMTIAAVHVGAIDESRKIKPTIPEFGQYRIPIRDEIEFEMMLDS